MFPSYTQYEAATADRRQRFEATARRHRLLGSLRRHRPVASGGATPAASLPSISLGRTPSGLDRQAA